MIDRAIADLIRYAEEKKLIAPEDRAWALNSLLEVLKLDSWTDPGVSEGPVHLPAVLDEILDDARPETFWNRILSFTGIFWTPPSWDV